MPSLTLFIDLCSHRKFIALVDSRKKTIALADIPDHTDEADLMPAIERLMKGEGLSLQDLGRIAAITGPGGFMSQRVELSLANTLSWSLKIPIAGVHLSEVWRMRTSLITDIPLSRSLERGVPQDGVRTVWLHSTQKSALFIRGFGEAAKQWPEAMLITLEDLKRSLSPLGGEGQGVGVVGELIPEHLAFFSPVPDAKLQSIERVLPELCKKAPYGQPPILPWYGRGI